MSKSERYIKNVLLSHKDGKYFIDKIRTLITWEEGCRILDVGCGPGNVTSDFLLPILPKSGTIIAIDKAAEVICYAKEHYEKSPHVNFVQMDIVFPDPQLYKTFDHVISLYCLHFVAEQEIALRNIYNMLKPGGNFFFTCVVQYNAFETFAAISGTEKWKPYIVDYKSYMSPYQQSKNPKDDLEKMLLAAGFDISFIVEEPRKYNYLINDIKEIFLSLDCITIPQDLEDEFQTDLQRIIRSLGQIQIENGDEFYCTKCQVLFGHVTKSKRSP
ncbi:juvenile hormone acid O-methyltransferase-like [Photinus pyralis]|nr:juvenile hormone acid O-methyltransferase-like [Photinus pyralis]